MLHRFRNRNTGVEGHDTDQLRRTLEYLRKHRYNLIGLHELVLNLRSDVPPVDRTVVFTIDEGYQHQATAAASVFTAFDCPVTIFVTTGFLDGDIWFWWDQIEFIFSSLEPSELTVPLAGSQLTYSCVTDAERRRAAAEFTSRCKHVAAADRLAGIAALAAAAAVDLPSSPPLKYAPMTWDQLRDCERRGITFGPHSVTHPILASTSDEQSRRELVESWNRLCREASDPVPVFCYPNGEWDDFGDREIKTLDEMGLLGAVTAVRGYVDAAGLQQESQGAFKIRRFGYPDSLPDVIQTVSGLERLKGILRGNGR
jgi:peptidoglycan/xylan/chitin deacetylase (PgdA/CDA1 family)